MTDTEVTYCDKCSDELEPSQVGLCDSCRPRPFAELSEKAKGKAREAYISDDYPYDEWWDYVYEDFEQICTILGIIVDRSKKRPAIYFSGFWSQGDCATFEGSYSFANDSPRRIRAYCNDTELHRIADELTSMQLTQRLLGLDYFAGQISSNNRVEIFDSGIDEIGEPDEERFYDLMHDLADWLYRRLEAEYEHLCSNEVVDRHLNDETFDEDGTII